MRTRPSSGTPVFLEKIITYNDQVYSQGQIALACFQ
jgi:hypothetical protein